MYKARLCMNLSPANKVSYEEQIRLLKQVGFDGFFSGWGSDVDVSSLRRVADETGMIYHTIHAPHTYVDKLWYPDNKTDEAIEELIRCVRDCAEYDVPIMVLHAFKGFGMHEPTEHGVVNFGKIIREAEKLHVKIALENTEGEEYLATLLDAYKDSEYVGFCWDCGHEMCYNYRKDMLSVHGDRLICMHLNDNLGTRDYNGAITFHDDLHLLPFDGIGDWQDIVNRLNKWGYDGILTFEVKAKNQPGRHENDVYERMDTIEYFTEAYKRACRVAALKIK